MGWLRGRWIGGGRRKRSLKDQFGGGGVEAEVGGGETAEELAGVKVLSNAGMRFRVLHKCCRAGRESEGNGSGRKGDACWFQEGKTDKRQLHRFPSRVPPSANEDIEIPTPDVAPFAI
jgi:hypothetical protein